MSLIAQPLTSASVTNPLLTGRMLQSMLARKESAGAWITTIQAPMRRERPCTAASTVSGFQ